MDIEYLHEYLAVADDLSLTVAARRLHTTQSTLSKHMAALGQEMGADLLRRVRNGVELTPAGAVLYRHARMVCDGYDGAKAEIAKLASQVPVRVGGMLQNGEVTNFLAVASSLLRREGPQGFSLVSSPGASFAEGLQRDEADLLLCHRTALLDDDSAIASKSLLKTPFIALVPSDGPLAEKPSVSMADLADIPIVQLVSDYAGGWQTIERACRAHGFEPRRYPLVVTGFLDCLTEPLGDAALILQRLLLPGGFMDRDDLRVVPVTDDDAYFEPVAYYRRADEAGLAPLLGVFDRAAAQVQRGVEQAGRPASSRPFQTRCHRLAQACGLNQTETEALIAFAKGRSLDRIGADMGLSRSMVGDTLARVYQKAGVHDKQELLDAIERVELG